MKLTTNNFASWVILAAGLAMAPWAAAQGQGAAPAVGRAGPPAAYSPPRMSMPKAYVPGAPMSAVGRQVRVPVYAIPPRTGSGLTRPLPLNFGGVRAELPGPIGRYTPPPSTTFYPYQRRSPGLHTVPRGLGGAAVAASDGSVGVHIGTGDAHRGGGDWSHGDRPAPDPGFYGHIGTSGATLGYRATGDGFSFRAHLGDPWLDRGRQCLWKQWGTCSPYSWNWGWGWGWSRYNNYSYGYPIYSPIWPYPDPLLSSYYYPPAPATQPDPADASAPALTVLEQADILLGYEQFDEAAAAYREHLSQHPDDAEALRMLAVTLLLDRHPREAGEAMLAAYRMNPSLADSPVVLPAGLGPSDLAVAANRAIEHAQRTRSAPSWLSAAVLSHARDKVPVARNFAKSAKAAGLDPEVYARLMSSWST
ncbi:MAG: tetratricopeptide repeat protein [Phycisphaerales bacterium]|nr:tetratricopeptide repeat protein [Phycisphaerales bacterium]